jgi:hypothetical protein
LASTQSTQRGQQLNATLARADRRLYEAKLAKPRGPANRLAGGARRASTIDHAVSA